jgi:hypothetical protein
MKYIKKYENNVNIIRVLGFLTLSLFDIETTLDSAKQYDIKAEAYIYKSNEIKDSIVIFPEIYKNNDVHAAVKYTKFINNGYGCDFYNWYSVKYVKNTLFFMGTNLEEIELYLTQNKYNL